MSTVMDPPAAPENVNVVDMLERHVLLVSPIMGWWRGHYVIDDAEIRIDKSAAKAEFFTKPQTKLLEVTERGKEWKKKFTMLDSERGRVVARYSLPSPIHGARLVPHAAATELLDALVGPASTAGVPQFNPHVETQSIAYRLKQYADDFVLGYDELIDDVSTKIPPAVWSRIKRLVPKRASVRDKFYLDVIPVALSNVGTHSSGRLDNDLLRQYNNSVQASVSRCVEEALSEMLTAPREALVEALNNLTELIGRNGNVTSRSFNPVREAVAKIRLFECVATPRLLEQMRNLEARLEMTTANTLDSVTATNNGFLAAIGSVRAEVEQSIANAEGVERFGRPLRRLNI